MKYLRRLTLWDWLLVLVAVAFLCIVLFGMTGCAAGVTKDGTIVVGLPIGEGDLDAAKATASSIGGLIGTAIGGPGGGLIGSGIGETLVVGLAGLLGWRSIKREKTAKAEADAAFDEGVRRGAAVSTPRTADLPVAPTPA